MRKKLVVCAAAVSLVFSMAIAGLSIAADPGPADMTLTTQKAKKPSLFPHKKHQETIKCGDCHHGMDADGKQVAYAEGQAIGKCESCHNESLANAKLNSYMKAAHANCKTCHKKLSKEGKKAPTKCAGCHPKKEGEKKGTK